MVLLALLLLAAPAAAPAAPTPAVADALPTTRGTMGVTFFLPNGGDSKLIGGTFFLANDLALRLDFGLTAPLKPSGAGQNTGYSLGVGLRLYQLKHERVAVFVQPDVTLGREASPAVS